MIKTTQYNYAGERLNQISHYRPLPGSAMALEQQELLELRAQYESVHNAEKKRKQEANDQIAMSAGYL